MATPSRAGIVLLLALLLPLCASACPIASAGRTAGPGPSGYPSVEPVRVAVLDSDAWPDYVAGVLHNEYERAYELLASDPMLDVMVITSDGILWGDLDSFDVDVLLLIDNVPETCLLYTSPSPRDRTRSRMPSSA